MTVSLPIFIPLLTPDQPEIAKYASQPITEYATLPAARFLPSPYQKPPIRPYLKTSLSLFPTPLPAFELMPTAMDGG